MKRLLILAALAGLCILCLISCDRPVETNPSDSIHFASEEESLLNISTDDVAFKVFCGEFASKFAKEEDIKAIAKESDKVVFWIVHSNGMYDCKEYKNEEMVRVTYSGWEKMHEYAVSPSTVFDSSVKVREVYCLDELGFDFSTCIYYDTDHGSFVLLKKNQMDEEVYLFPLSVFCEMSEAVYNERILNANNEGIPTYEDVYDLEPYILNPDSLFEP